METWYRTIKYYYKNENQIIPVDVVKSTDKTVTIKTNNREERVHKVTEWHNYFKTYDEAYLFLKNRYLKEIEDLTERLKKKRQDYLSFLRDYTK